jgi:hypothetical protein
MDMSSLLPILMKQFGLPPEKLAEYRQQFEAMVQITVQRVQDIQQTQLKILSRMDEIESLILASTKAEEELQEAITALPTLESQRFENAALDAIGAVQQDQTEIERLKAANNDPKAN